MNFTDSELAVLKNFASINPSMVIHKDRLEVINNSKSTLASFTFDKEYDFEEFGIYVVPDFLQAIGAFKNPDLDVKSDHVLIKDGNQKIKFFTTPTNIIPKFQDLGPKFKKLTPELDFDLPGDKLAMIFKTASILKADFLFFESTDDGEVRITITNDLKSSANSFEVVIRENVRTSDLSGMVIKMSVGELKLVPGDYKVQVSTKQISRWESYNGIDYFIGCKLNTEA